MLHLISFNIPFPANYGGVIDVFYKIKALHQQGIKIHLHCYEYGRGYANELLDFCEKVNYYPRTNTLTKQFSTLPFIVNSRNSKALLENLLHDDHPILFEGLHCCAFLDHPKLKGRQKIVRMHNVEWQYYAHLASVEVDFLKKNYFKLEAKRLFRFEKILKHADTILAISPADLFYFQKKYPKANIHYVPAFHPNEKVEIKSGRGDYALFHGDLSVKDNEEAVLWLVNEISQKIDYQLVIAGLNPSEKLKKLIAGYSNISLQANVSDEVMTDLVQNAHVNVLLSFHSAGMKLKLLNALYRGRFCLVNSKMVNEERLEELCYVENTPDGFRKILITLFEKTFSEKEIEKRRSNLGSSFSNETSALKIINSCLPDR